MGVVEYMEDRYCVCGGLQDIKRTGTGPELYCGLYEGLVLDLFQLLNWTGTGQ